VPKGQYVAIAARQLGIPVGLALVVVGHTSGARLLSVFVAKHMRRRGIGSALTAAACDAARHLRATTIDILFGTRIADFAGVNAFFAQAGWPPPEAVEFRLAGRADWVTRSASAFAPFLASVERRGYSHTPWVKINDQDRLCVRKLVSLIDYPNQNPMVWEANADPALSLALRRKGILVGWVLAENYLPNYIHYVCGWVEPELQRLGWLMAALFRVCEQQLRICGPHTTAVYETPSGNTRMVRMMKERLSPYTEWMDELMRSRRPL